jgi:hypothetical protein
MKTIWLILLTMVLFNGFLLAFSMFFNTPMSSGLYNINNVTGDNTFSSYKTPGTLSFSVVEIAFTSGVFLTSAIIGLLMTLLTKNLQYVAAGAMVGIISSMWIATSSIFTDIMNNNVILLAIYSLISIAIGIIVAVLVLGMFTGQDQLGY